MVFSMTYKRAASFSIHVPTCIEFGWGASERIDELLLDAGRHCLLVTQANLLSLPAIDGIRKAVEAAGKTVHLHIVAEEEPDSASVDRAGRELRGQPIDLVLAIGGGSVIDFAKAVSIVLTHEGPIWDYVGYTGKPARQFENQLPTIVAVPTTSGTGSEVTPYAVLINNKLGRKAAISSPLIAPKVAIVDPELTVTMPVEVTAYTGADALAHAIESFLNAPMRTPFSAMVALEAIRTGAKALPDVLKDGTDRQARSAMAWTSLMGGLAISMAGTGVGHAMAEVLGGLTHVAHGKTVAVFLPAVLRLLEDYYKLPLPMLRAALGDGSRPASEQVWLLWQEVGLPLTLPELGVGQGELSQIRQDTLDYMGWAMSASPVALQSDDVDRILSYVWPE